MLKRKVEPIIKNYLEAPSNRIMLVNGARQVGKSYIIRKIGQELFTDFIEINFAEDKNGDKFYEPVKSAEDFYFRLTIRFGDILSNPSGNVLIFLDEIQEYPQFLTLLKFFNQDNKYRFIASCSLLGVTLNNVVSIPVGSIRFLDMYPLDFEEFLWANRVSDSATAILKKDMEEGRSPDLSLHEYLMGLWKKFLVVGGLPAAVNAFVETQNYSEVRSVQADILRLYAADASKYDKEKKLMITRLFNLIPSNMENKKKRVVAKSIENLEKARYAKYQEEFEYLISAGIALDVRAIANPKFPLPESMQKNLIKLYYNDPGLLTAVLYKGAIEAVLDDIPSINLGSVYETAVAAQLKANGHNLFYYDNKKKGEVDFLINDYHSQSVIPIEVKSGKDYKIHSAISKLTDEPEYHIKKGLVLTNSSDIHSNGKIWYYPIYFSTFIGSPQ